MAGSSSQGGAQELVTKFDRNTLRRMRTNNEEQNAYLEAAEKFFDRWETDLKQKRSEVEAGARKNDSDRRALRAERDAFNEEKQKEQALREKDQQAAVQKSREIAMQEADLKNLQNRVQSESMKIKEREADVEQSRRRLQEERNKFTEDCSAKTLEFQIWSDNLQKEQQMLEDDQSKFQEEVNQLELNKNELAAREAAWNETVAEERQRIRNELDALEQQRQRLNAESERSHRSDQEIENKRRDFEEEKQMYNLDVQERESGLAQRESLFRSEVAEFLEREREAGVEKTKLRAENEQLSERMRTFQQDESKRTNKLNSWETTLNSRQANLEARDEILVAKENDYKQRDDSLRAEMEDFQNDKQSFYDDSNARMVALNEEEIRVKDQKAQLELDLAQYKRELLQLNSTQREFTATSERRTNELDQKEAALTNMAQQQERERAEIENGLRSIKSKEQALVQSREEFEAEKRRVTAMAHEARNERIASEQMLRDIQDRERAITMQSNALDERERLMNVERSEMDVREANLRKAEGPFMDQKQRLEEKEALLNERDADLGAREDEFRARAAAAWEEIEGKKNMQEKELALLKQERANVENRDVELQRMSQTRQDDLDRREEILRQKEEQMQKDLEQLNADQENLNKHKAEWKRVVGFVGDFAHVPEGQEGEEIRRSLQLQMDTLRPHLTSQPSGSGVMVSDPVEMQPLEIDQAQSDFTRETRSKRRVEERDATAEIEVEDRPITRASKSRKQASKPSSSKAPKKRQRKTAASEIVEEEESEPGTPKRHRRSVRKGDMGCGWNERQTVRKPSQSVESSAQVPEAE